METNALMFHLSAAFLLGVTPVLGTIALVTLRENYASAFSMTNMLSAGLYFALGITGHHMQKSDDSALFFFAKNVVISVTFLLMVQRNQSATNKDNSIAKYSRVVSSEDGLEMTGPTQTANFALDAPAGISPHFPVILAVFSYFSFIEAMKFAQVGHTEYGPLSEMLMNKLMMSICFGTAAAADSVMTKSFPKLAPLFFLSSPVGILAGVFISAELPIFLMKYTYFTINGVCLYVATCQLLPDELRIRDASALRLFCFAIGFMAVFSTEYFMY